MGNVSFRLHDGTTWELREVRYVPDLKRNLISLGLIDQNGFTIKLEFGRLLIMKGSKIVMKGSKRNVVCVLDGEAIISMTGVIVGTGGENTKLWHLTLGHMSIKRLKELKKQGVLGNDKKKELDFCEDYVFGKSTRNCFKNSTSKSLNILDYVHSDLWRPAQTSLLGGNSYFFVSN